LTLNMNKENTTNHQIAMWTDQTSWYQISKSIKHKKIKYNPKLLCGSISNIARKKKISFKIKILQFSQSLFSYYSVH
jgi:hypothetical protein